MTVGNIGGGLRGVKTIHYHKHGLDMQNVGEKQRGQDTSKSQQEVIQALETVIDRKVAPVAALGEVTEESDYSRQTVHDRLKDAVEASPGDQSGIDNDVRSAKVGGSKVYWINEIDHQSTSLNSGGESPRRLEDETHRDGPAGSDESGFEEASKLRKAKIFLQKRYFAAPWATSAIFLGCSLMAYSTINALWASLVTESVSLPVIVGLVSIYVTGFTFSAIPLMWLIFYQATKSKDTDSSTSIESEVKP